MLTPADEKQITDDSARRAAQETLERVSAGRESLDETLNECLYYADKRSESKPLTDDERTLFERVRRAVQSKEPSAMETALGDLTRHYSAEICGHFNPRMYNAASKLAPGLFSVLLSATSPLKLLNPNVKLPDVSTRIVLSGEIDLARNLSEKGTLICTPTHSSHMDSLVIGYALYRAGLPPFIYGAGKNLFDHRFLGYFMSNLGAYKVDRLKDESLYKRSLRSYAMATLARRLPNLFFPGGTRTRSGAVEADLKLGLLGTGVEIFAENLAVKREPANVYILPVTISYQLALEAETLIEDYLKEEGKSRYIIDDDEFSRPERVLNFVGALLALDGQIHVRFGRPLDPFGNDVDDDGRSVDPRGNTVDHRRYVYGADGYPRHDLSRDREYTRELGSAIVQRFRSENVILSTHLTCFALFHLMVEKSGETDLYRILRSPKYDDGFPIGEVRARVAKFSDLLHEMHEKGRIRLAPDVLHQDAEKIVRRAERTLSLYHLPAALERRGVKLYTGNAALIYYYHNRLTGYGLDPWPRLVPRAKKGNRR